ncbi:MAG: 4Fe-4S dicluster domain-containing protein [Planctomycetes bacterium]|nr:4Fe-4S dicluster domain-containing protein [Planctomycetota bacterium]
MAYTIVRDACEGVADCLPVCPTECILGVGGQTNAKGTRFVRIDAPRCIDCGACLSVCPIEGAILDEWQPALQRDPPGLPCLRCRRAIPPGSRFCPSCRAPVASKCRWEDMGLLDAEGLGRVVKGLEVEDLCILLGTAEPLLANRLGAAIAPDRACAVATDLQWAPAATGRRAEEARSRATFRLMLLAARSEVSYEGPG